LIETRISVGNSKKLSLVIKSLLGAKP
jgi:hypothetical protein